MVRGEAGLGAVGGLEKSLHSQKGNGVWGMVGIPLLWTSREGTLRHLCEVIAAIEGDTMQLFACKVVG